jgi:hypothetical protein
MRCLHLRAFLSISWKLSDDFLSFLVNRFPSPPITTYQPLYLQLMDTLLANHPTNPIGAGTPPAP